MAQDAMPPAVAPDKPSSFLARRRDKTTRKTVLIADKVADLTITVGGIGVIVAVFGIMVFLAEVVVPLFTGGSIVGHHEFAKAGASGRVLMNRVDEYKTLSVTVTETGTVSAFHFGTGSAIEVRNYDLGGAPVTAFARSVTGADIALGFADGTVRFGKLAIESQILPAAQLPPGLAPLSARDSTDGKAIYSRVPGDQVRRLSVGTSLGDPAKVADGQAIVAIDYRFGGTVERPSQAFVTVDAAGNVRLSRSESRRNMLTGALTTTIDTATLPALPADKKMAGVLMTDKADQVYVADVDGVIRRYDTRDFGSPALAETRDVFPGADRLTAMSFLLGEQTLVVGGSNGAVDAYFRLARPGAGTADGFEMVRARRMEPHGAAVVAISPGERGKSFVTADAAGHVWMRHSTSDQTLVKAVAGGGTMQTAVITPRDDGMLAIAGDGRVHAWDVDAPHPESTVQTIFGKVWYEGYSEPTYTWQSSAATDSFEPKLSLVPLIFGTLKATIYSLLFAVPVALLGAIYTSEFVHHRVRATVKPVMEMMASLPSVVLGFIAALVLAPIVETWIAAVLLAFVVLPLGLLVGAYLWQLLPGPIALRLGGLPKFALMFVAISVGGLLAYEAGAEFERWFFHGDFKAWVNGDVGSAMPFLFLLLAPFAFAMTATVVGRAIGPRFQRRLRGLSRTRAGLLDGGRWLAMVLVATAVAYVLALVLNALGVDARGGVVDTYVQRNTLVVGFAMGFAVIPIIYTIAEDALNSVPEHLRAASLSCGATPWQTAINVILPTAISGVFAAIMIGMGRAVGETMIVVMAAGNTPLLEWNIFNGLRALSANIAVELPEAVKDSTLYRMLFLAAMTLFIMTFVVNTVAEVIRLRFRKRATQL